MQKINLNLCNKGDKLFLRYGEIATFEGKFEEKGESLFRGELSDGSYMEWPEDGKGLFRGHDIVRVLSESDSAWLEEVVTNIKQSIVFASEIGKNISSKDKNLDYILYNCSQINAKLETVIEQILEDENIPRY